MGLFDFLKGKPKEKKEHDNTPAEGKALHTIPEHIHKAAAAHDVCIPEHRKTKEQRAQKTPNNPLIENPEAHKERDVIEELEVQSKEKKSTGKQTARVARELDIDAVAESGEVTEDSLVDSQMREELEGQEGSETLTHLGPPQNTLRNMNPAPTEKGATRFAVNGVYEGGDTMMISGFVEAGALAKRMTLKKDKKEIVITDIKINSRTVEQLTNGQEGTIFVKSTKGRKTPFIKYGDVLEFY